MAAKDTIEIVLRAFEEDFDNFDQHPERLLMLEPNKTIPVGRASKSSQKPELMSARDNAYIDSPVISRDHAVLSASYSSGDLLAYITGSNSMHGTLINNKKLQPNQREQLHDGDLLQFGADVIRDDEHFAARKYVFGIRNAAPPSHRDSFSQGFSVPDSDDERAVPRCSMTSDSRYGSQHNPVRLDDETMEQSKPTIAGTEPSKAAGTRPQTRPEWWDAPPAAPLNERFDRSESVSDDEDVLSFPSSDDDHESDDGGYVPQYYMDSESESGASEDEEEEEEKENSTLPRQGSSKSPQKEDLDNIRRIKLSSMLQQEDEKDDGVKSFPSTAVPSPPKDEYLGPKQYSVKDLFNGHNSGRPIRANRNDSNFDVASLTNPVTASLGWFEPSASPQYPPRNTNPPPFVSSVPRVPPAVFDKDSLADLDFTLESSALTDCFPPAHFLPSAEEVDTARAAGLFGVVFPSTPTAHKDPSARGDSPAREEPSSPVRQDASIRKGSPPRKDSPVRNGSPALQNGPNNDDFPVRDGSPVREGGSLEETDQPLVEANHHENMPMASGMQTPPPISTLDDSASSSPPIRRTKVSIGEILGTPQQPPTPESVPSLKRKAEVLEEQEDNLLENAQALPCRENEDVTNEDAGPVTAPRPPKRRRLGFVTPSLPRPSLIGTMKTAAWLIPGAAVTLFMTLPDEFFMP